MLNINLIYDELPEGKRQEEITFIRRTAVRGIIYDRDRLLMVQTRLGDYKFPGGGVQENETSLRPPSGWSGGSSPSP